MVIFSTSGFIGKLSFAWIENWFIFFSSEEFSLVSWKPKGCMCSSVFFLFPWPLLFFFHFQQIAGKQLKCLQSAENMQDTQIF